MLKYGTENNIYIVCTPPPPLSAGGGGWASDQIFKKGGLDGISIFRGGVTGKEESDIFQGGGGVFQFLHKK